MNPQKPNTANPAVIRWVDETAELCQPDQVFWCDGSEAEKKLLTEEAVARGVLIRLNQQKLPGCYYHRSNPSDVARSEDRTFICSETADDAGPTNNWVAPGGNVPQTQGPLRRGDARTHPLRGSLPDGAARLRPDESRNRVDRFDLRGVEHEDRHPHGPGGL